MVAVYGNDSNRQFRPKRRREEIGLSGDDLDSGGQKVPRKYKMIKRICRKEQADGLSVLIQDQIEIIDKTDWIDKNNIFKSIDIVATIINNLDSENINILYDAWKIKTQKILQDNFNLLEIANGGYLDDPKVLIGFYIAIEKISEYLFNCKKKADLERNYISNNQYCLKIIELLYKESFMTHRKLADSLGVTINNLSNIMKRLKGCNLFDFIKHGREKIYRLTTDGEEFCKSHFKNND